MTPFAPSMANEYGFHKPGILARGRHSPERASSPSSEQGGSPGLLIRAVYFARNEYISCPESAASVAGLSTSVSYPTTTDSAATAVPSLRSADAGPALAPSALAWPTASRWWSAPADDVALSAFPLDLLPSRPEESLARHFFSSGRPPGPVRGEKRRLKAYSASRSAKR
jgi:hypothetical protein